MYKIKNTGENCFYIKTMGTFPPLVAEKFVKEFEEIIRNNKKIRVIVDLSDSILLKISSIEIILNLLKKNNKKLYKSAFVIRNNPPLDKEIKFILDKAASPKRIIVSDLNEAKKWLGISDIII
ncbi:MAG: hypothetical protein ACTSRI_10365 [Promethearchaeota archaeon]